MLNNIVLFRAIYSCTGDAQVTVNNAAIWTQAGQGTDSDVEREKANREAANRKRRIRKRRNEALQPQEVTATNDMRAIQGYCMRRRRAEVMGEECDRARGVEGDRKFLKSYHPVT